VSRSQPMGYPFLANGSPEKFLKKLVGRTDVEDALRRLDKLTQEEARMAAAEGRKATHGIDHKVEDVGDKVKAVGDRIQNVDGRVKDVGDKMIDGAQITFTSYPHTVLNIFYD
jgi:hypothetical protein